MTLADYKFIYFWEWIHRLLARADRRLLFALPLAWFWVARQIPAGYKPRLLALLALGGLQGVSAGGWCARARRRNVEVSHFWLVGAPADRAVHAGRPGLDRARPAGAGARSGEHAGAADRVCGRSCWRCWSVQLLLGAWVAGLRAARRGRGWFNSDAWPLMQGRLFPDGVDWARRRVGWALRHDPFLIHFLHRWWAWVAGGGAGRAGAQGARGTSAAASIAIHAAFGTQILLGIATVWSGVALWLAVLHQLVGALLVAATAGARTRSGGTRGTGA